jgi:pimeloyl-ACP methyl ester carboxylesterase
MASFVLIPAAWCGGWSWKFVVPYLRDAGHDVYPVTFTGMGDRAHLDFETHVTDVVNVLHYEDLHDVILVGWSYGGPVGMAVGHLAPERVRHLVLLDTYLVPSNGQSIYDLLPGARARDEKILQAGNGWQLPPPPNAAFQLSVPDDALREWFVQRLTPQPAKTQNQPIRLGNPVVETLPRTLIRCTQSAFWSEEVAAGVLARIEADPAWEVLELDARHIAPVAQPSDTAAVLMRADRHEA